MAKRPPAFHLLMDAEPDVAVIRYDGDRETWDRLVREYLSYIGEDESRAAEIAEPVVKWYRMNVCPPDHWLGWAWQICEVDGPGRGQWRGAMVRWAEVV